MPNPTMTRLFGGPPLAVLGKLVLLSILIGVVLHALNFDPWDLMKAINNLIVEIWNMGFKGIELVWRYFLLGAVLVVPIWLILRLIRAPRGQ